MNYQIRKPKQIEAEKLAAFLVSNAGDQFGQLAEDYIQCMFSGNYRRPTFLVAIEGQDIIGSAAYTHEMFTLLPMWGISWVNVRSDKRNRGLGQSLLEACIDAIRSESNDEATIILSTLPGKSALYERLGFKKGGIDHAGGWIMLKTLDDPQNSRNFRYHIGNVK